MAASRKLLSLAALSKCFSMFNKREERRRARGRGSQQFTFFRWGHYVRAPDAGADAPLQLWRPFATRLVAPRSVVNICIRGKSRERPGREGRGQWATSVRRMPVTCFTYVCFARTKNKTNSRQNKNCLSTTITTSRERGKGRGSERESSRLRLASLWVSAWVSANVLLSKPVQQWQQCHKLSRAFGANSDLATAGDRGVWASWGWAGGGGVCLWRVAAFKCCANVNTNKMLSVCS